MTRLKRWLRTAVEQHWLALASLVLPIGLVVWASEWEGVWFVLILPLSAFVVGVVLRPRHAWFVWLGAVVIQWIAMGVLGKYADPEGETVLSLVLEAVPLMAMGVLVPVWLGRTVRNLMEQNRHSGATPARPAS
jgi:hypothetical protein